ncbi:MAG: hypothetical protein R3B81_10125 [bacterium]
MFQEFFHGSDLLMWPLVALGIFFALFVGAVVHAVFGLRGRRLDHVSSLPLQSDDEGRTA